MFLGVLLLELGWALIGNIGCRQLKLYKSSHRFFAFICSVSDVYKHYSVIYRFYEYSCVRLFFKRSTLSMSFTLLRRSVFSHVHFEWLVGINWK